MDIGGTPGFQSCTVEEYQRFKGGDRSLHCLSRGQSIGLLIATQTGFISFLAVLYVFGIITRNVWRRGRRHRTWRVFVDPIDVTMFSLFLGDLIQALGGIVNVKWLNEGKVEVGTYCTVQGILQQLGETAVAMSTLLIAIYTFRGLWVGRAYESLRLTKAIVAAIWGFVILMTILGNALNRHKDNQHRYGTPTPYWCWIGKDYLQWRIWGEYFWFWLTLGVSIFTYIPLFFWSRGEITPHPKSWWRFNIRRVNSRDGDEFPAELRNQAKIMLAYPVVYCTSILPLSVARWIGFVQERNGGESRIPSAATFFAVSCHLVSGAFNVILLLTTRPNTPMFGKSDDVLDDVLDQPPLPPKDPDRVGRKPERNTLPAPAPAPPLHLGEDRELGRLPSR